MVDNLLMDSSNLRLKLKVKLGFEPYLTIIGPYGSLRFFI